jgi:hypothetical protein
VQTQAESNLSQRIPAGDTLKPWIALGPLHEDLSATVQGLTLFEQLGATIGAAVMGQIVAQAQQLLSGSPHEGQTATFRGHSLRWQLTRRPEPYLSWGTYNISNHLGAIFLSTRLTSDQPGTRRLCLTLRLPSRALVAVNGQTVLDTAAQTGEPKGTSRLYPFQADLQPGANVVTVALFRLGRMARVGCRLQLLGADAEVAVPLDPAVDPSLRAGVERAMLGLALERDLFHPEDDLAFILPTEPPAGVTLHMRLIATPLSSAEIREGEADPAALPAATFSTAGRHVLCCAADLPDGAYQLLCILRGSSDTGGHAVAGIAGTVFDLRKVTPTPAPLGYDRYADRAHAVLEHFAVTEDASRSHGMIWREVARYALGRYEDVDETRVRWVCEFIAARKDCADFAVQGVLRLMYWERHAERTGEGRRLSPELTALMKDTVLGFKYWVDEPGDTVMFMGSENHRLLFHVAEWMAGQLFPLDEFSNSFQRGLYHATKGRTYIAEWLRQRGRFGFDEWHSNSYFPIDIAPLVNVYDFAIAEDHKLRQMAGAVLDYIHFIHAADSLRGVLGTTHGRSYGVYVKYPDMEGTATTCWLLYGTGSLVRGPSGMAPVSLATSKYVVPEILYRIAHDHEATVESRQRQGVLHTGSLRHANFVVYRAPDYPVSAVQDHCKGEYETSTHVAQLTLAGRDKSGRERCAVIFWSCPETIGEGSGLRPDYWSGHTTMPRVIQHRNVLALTWRLSEFAWMTHCLFEQSCFDEVRFAEAQGGKWAFARLGDAYAGTWSQHAFAVGQTGQFAGRELQCAAPENTWIAECGRATDWPSFDAFVTALSSAAISSRDGAVTYNSPSIGPFTTGWDVTATVNGEPIQTRGYPMVESPWAHSAFGSGELAITYGGERYEVWLNL